MVDFVRRSRPREDLLADLRINEVVVLARRQVAVLLAIGRGVIREMKRVDVPTCGGRVTRAAFSARDAASSVFQAARARESATAFASLPCPFRRAAKRLKWQASS